MGANMEHLLTSPGTVALAKSSTTDVRSSSVSVSSEQTLRISFVQPPGPGELPVGLKALRKLARIRWC